MRDMQEIAETMSTATGTLTGCSARSPAVSLLVGGIGIMNIMLVNVTERTREIGIRLAIGALAGEVLVAVSGRGGGAVADRRRDRHHDRPRRLAGAPRWRSPSPLRRAWPIIALAVGFSALIGIVFGFFPALRGARLDPIDALRHE